MQSQGTDEEEAARVLGAGFFTTFLRVTLPNVKWALLYGIVLCTARAVGEFGAVSVVSGHIRGATNTLPLHIETLYNEYAFQGAFAAASLLTLVALATMAAKALLSRRARRGGPVSIEVRSVSKSFGSFLALDDVSLRVGDGELVALLGPSGSGKTSLLRIIAGLEEPDRGTVLFHGEDATRRDARERRVGFVFQHYALFRRMTVFENVAFGLRVKPRAERPPEAEVKRRVTELLKLVQLDWLGDRLPSELSGGQRQRVALARALAVEPKVLLLDEPFGSLDARVRQELRRWLRRLHDEIRLTSLFVTHDQEEALEVADRVVLLDRGRVVQDGTPQELFEKPAGPFVLDFLGSVNIFHGRVQNGRAHLGPLSIDYPEHPHAESLPASGYARSWEIDLSRDADGTEGFLATLRHVSVAGAVVRLELAPDDGPPLKVEISRERFEELAPAPGERLRVTPRKVRVFVSEATGDDAPATPLRGRRRRTRPELRPSHATRRSSPQEILSPDRFPCFSEGRATDPAVPGRAPARPGTADTARPAPFLRLRLSRHSPAVSGSAAQRP